MPTIGDVCSLKRTLSEMGLMYKQSLKDRNTTVVYVNGLCILATLKALERKIHADVQDFSRYYFTFFFIDLHVRVEKTSSRSNRVKTRR